MLTEELVKMRGLKKLQNISDDPELQRVIAEATDQFEQLKKLVRLFVG